MKLRTVLTAILLAIASSSCFSGNQNSSVTDLESAFQGGCSTNSAPLAVALSQTQSLINTIQDLRTKNQCSGINTALTGAQNLNAQIYRLQQDPTSLQMNGLQQAQNTLLAQINQTTDPTSLETLTESYSYNAVELATLQGQEATLAGSGLTTPLQLGYSEANAYVTNLQSIAPNVNDCVRDNPLFGAQLAAQLVSVSGSFMAPQMGTALAVGGAVLSTVFSYFQDAQYSDAINGLNLNMMTSSLSCGLESITDGYCEAQDMMTLTELEECGYNPTSSPNCPQQVTSSSSGSDIPTTPFWKGLDALSRSLPALQIWVGKVVSGVPPADTYDANRINDPKDARATLDHINELATGWENQESQLIVAKLTDSDKHLETVNALASLVSILAYGQKSAGNCQFGGQCTSSAILTYYQSTAAILYSLVGQSLNGCSASLGGTCLDATTILLPGDVATVGPIDPSTGKPSIIRTNGNGGWPTILQNEQLLFQSVYQLVDDQVHVAIDVDPTAVLEAAKIAAGSGLPTPFDALSNLSAFLKTSYDFYSTIPPNLIEGGEEGRKGTLKFLGSSKAMLDFISAALLMETGMPAEDEKTVKSIYDTLNLSQDPNFVSERLTLHIQEDVKTRIKAGQIPRNAAEILLLTTVDPATQLTSVPPAQIENTMRSLAQAASVSELNVQSFVSFFAPAMGQVLNLLNANADKDQEPRGGSPRTAIFRSQQAQICILIAASQPSWPSAVDLGLCKGTFYKSDLTGETLAFDDIYGKMTQPKAAVKDRICSFYTLLKHSTNFTREKSR